MKTTFRQVPENSQLISSIKFEETLEAREGEAISIDWETKTARIITKPLLKVGMLTVKGNEVDE